MKVVPFKPRTQQTETDPHLAGKAHCVGCRHTWSAVAPVGATWLECPECHANKGVFTNHCYGKEGVADEVWTCKCGCELFFWFRKGGALCPNCGTVQKF